LAAAKVGGILANDRYSADLLRDNLAIELNVITAADRHGVKKLLFLGSSCIYPKNAPQPLREELLLTGPLEATNEGYAVAKIAGIKLCQAFRKQHGSNFISLMPSNLYGPGDNFDLETAHVLPALVRKFHEARESDAATVTIWGSGKPRREFLHVDDLASACLLLMESYDEPEIINVGVGEDLSIREIAELVKETVNFKGDIVHDLSKPDGTPRKLLDVSRIRRLGWTASIGIKEGLGSTYAWYRDHLRSGSIRGV
jgi:GDP-L-fucose synthase